MFEVALYLEIAGIAIGENSFPAPAGVKITLGNAPAAIEYAKLAEAAAQDLETVLYYRGPIKARPEDITIITPEEYEERYGDR